MREDPRLVRSELVSVNQLFFIAQYQCSTLVLSTLIHCRNTDYIYFTYIIIILYILYILYYIYCIDTLYIIYFIITNYKQ